MLTYENEARNNGYHNIAGVDEAGRGPLAGPVVASAVVLPEYIDIPGLTDSKQLSAKKRDELFYVIKEKALAVESTVISNVVIDKINILQASLLAMRESVKKIRPMPDFTLIDGNQNIQWPGAQRAIIKGDALSLSIAAASVIAKVLRDTIMQEYALEYPEYGFEKHKGYGAKAHREAIEKYGPCPIHRKTFKGVRERLSAEQKLASGERQMEIL